jgi:hypothetical protein
MEEEVPVEAKKVTFSVTEKFPASGCPLSFATCKENALPTIWESGGRVAQPLPLIFCQGHLCLGCPVPSASLRAGPCALCKGGYDAADAALLPPLKTVAHRFVVPTLRKMREGWATQSFNFPLFPEEVIGEGLCVGHAYAGYVVPARGYIEADVVAEAEDHGR